MAKKGDKKDWESIESGRRKDRKQRQELGAGLESTEEEKGRRGFVLYQGSRGDT